MSVLKAFIFSLVAAAILAGVMTVGGVPAILFVAILAAIIIAAKSDKKPRVFIKNDGFEYKASFKDCVTIKWSNVSSVDFEYANHPDLDSYWNFKMSNAQDIRVAIRAADQEILLPAMARNLEGLCCDHLARMDGACQESGEKNANGYLVTQCWGRNP